MSFGENGNSLSATIICKLKNSSVSSLNKQHGRVTPSTDEKGLLPFHAASEMYLLVTFPIFINALLQIYLTTVSITHNSEWMGD
jgi:hypothetical protein